MGRTQKSQIAYLDTHVVVWLYEGLIEKLGKEAMDVIELSDLYISPMVLLELQYLHQIGRIKPKAMKIMSALEQDIGLGQSDMPLAAVVSEALDVEWTRDPFDRLIVAEAEIKSAALVTKDRMILKYCHQAVW